MNYHPPSWVIRLPLKGAGEEEPPYMFPEEGPEPQRGNPSCLAWILSGGPFIVISFHLGIFFGVKYISEGVIRYRINVFLIVLATKTLEDLSITNARETPSHLFQCIPKSVPLSSLFRSELLWALSVAAVYQLLSLLTLLLERTLQESAIYRVIHILILKPGAQHSLPLSLTLDYICPIKRVFKSHVRGCGLNAKVYYYWLQKHWTQIGFC